MYKALLHVADVMMIHGPMSINARRDVASLDDRNYTGRS